MYQPGQGGGGEQHPQHLPPHGYYPQPGAHPPPAPGMHNMMPPAPRSGQLPPPHTYAMPPPGPPPPGPPPPGPQPPGPIPFVQAAAPPHSATFIPPQQHYGQPYNPAAYPPGSNPQHSAPYMPQQVRTPFPYAVDDAPVTTHRRGRQHEGDMPWGRLVAPAAGYGQQPTSRCCDAVGAAAPGHPSGLGKAQPPPEAIPGPAPATGSYPGFGMPLNPLGLMAAGNLFGGGQGWGQQYVERMQQRVGAFTGGALHFHFAINKQYVLSKLLMLIAPYLKRWTYSRQPEQLQGGPAFKPPRVDVNSPDLYIPLMGLWTYSLLVCAVQATRGKFKPDNVYPLVWSACVAWLVHLLVAKFVLRAMALPASVPWVELAAYTGYPFVSVCLSIVVGQLGGRWAYWAAWAYGSMCTAIFLVRTMKRVIFQETRGYGRDLTLVNYLLLALALFQFPYAFYLGVRP